MENKVFKALAHPVRRQIMSLLRDGPKSSGELADTFSAAWPTVTRHLNTLKDAGLITAERRANSIIYRANTSLLEDAAAALLALMGKDNGDDELKEAAE